LKRGTVLGVSLLVGLGFAAVLVGMAHTGASSSSLSRAPTGLLAARRYLERSDAHVRLLDAPLRADELTGVLVVALPWQRRAGPGEIDQIAWFARRGGTVLVAYSGEHDNHAERAVLRGLDLELETVRPDPPLAPWDWYRYRTERWRLHAGHPSLLGLRPVMIAAPRAAPSSPDGASILLRGGPSELTLAFTFSLEAGRVVVVPAAALSNAGALEPGNIDLLATLHDWLGDDWSFDELHHGLVDPDLAAAAGSTASWDLFGAHLGALYLLTVFALSRRFGPVWRERPPVAGSAAAFLRNLGGLHRRLGHQRSAAVRLVERARLLDPRLAADATVEAEAAAVTDDDGLIALARKIAGMQHRRVAG